MVAPMTGFPFESRTTPCNAAFFGALCPGRRCCATDCWGTLDLAPEANVGARDSTLKSQHKHATFEINVRQLSRIPSGPGGPVSFGEKELESFRNHSIFRRRQICCNSSAGTIWVPIFAPFNHDCTTDLQND